MAEYAGYVRRETPIDWNSVAGDIVNQLGDVKKEQAATRKANDELAADTYAQIGKYDAGQSPQVNELAYNMITQGRATLDGMMKKLKNREITQDAFNRANMSMQTQNQEFKDMLSSYNTSVMDIEKGISEGTLSNLNNFNLNKFKDLSDLSNKQFQWVPKENGIVNMYVNTIDKEGNTIKNPQSLGSIRAWEQKRYAGYDLDSNLNESVKTLAVFDIGREKDQRLNPEYKRTKEAIIEQTLGDDERIATILADYDGYAGYEEGQEVPEKGIKMVLQPNGSYKEEITPELRKRATEIVEQGIERRLGRTEREAKPPKEKKDGYTTSQINKISEGYDATIAAAGGDFRFMDNEKYNFYKDPDGKGGFTISVADKKGNTIQSGLERGSQETAKVMAPYYTDKFGGTDWEYIHNIKKSKPKKDDEFTAEKYVLEDNLEDVELIEGITKSDDADILKSKSAIKEIILSKSPNAEIKFGEFNTDPNISELTINVNGKDFKIKTDASLGAAGAKKENFNVFEEIINYSYSGGTPRPDNNVAENNQEEEFLLD
tara:strand:+ start:4558 stop:6192 length:1635 start_codon:yes stop_codon:yes gene_type:complete